MKSVWVIVSDRYPEGRLADNLRGVVTNSSYCIAYGFSFEEALARASSRLAYMRSKN